MKEEQVRQALQQITQDEIPSIAYRGEQIKVRAAQVRRASASSTSGILLTRVAVVLVMLMGVVLLSAPRYRYNTVTIEWLNQPTPDAPTAFDNLRTPLNLSQTIRGVTVTLESIYFDVHTIRLRYNVTGKDEQFVRKISRSFGYLCDGLGNCFSGGANGAANLPSERPIMETLPDGSSRATMERFYNTEYFYRPLPPGQTFSSEPGDYLRQYRIPPETVDLTFRLNAASDIGIIISEVPPTPVAAGERTPEVFPTADPETLSYGEDDVFRFEFTTPLYQAVTLTSDASTTADEVSFNITRVALSPARTTVRLCSKELPAERGWSIYEPTLKLGDEVGTWRIIRRDGSCYIIDVDVYYDGQPATLTLEFGYLQTGGNDSPNGVEEWEKVRPLLEERGITFDMIFEGRGYRIDVHYLDGSPITDYEALNKIYRDVLYKADLRARVVGPWQFTVEISQQE